MTALQAILTVVLLLKGDFHQASTSFTLTFWMVLTIHFERKYRDLLKERKQFKEFLDDPKEFN